MHLECYFSIIIYILAMRAGFIITQTVDTTTLLTPTTATVDAIDKDCIDQDREGRCAFWAKFGACKSHRERMLGLCKRSCNFCEGSCNDYNNAKCRWLASHKACLTNPKRMKKMCPEACGHCIKAQSPAACTKSKYGCCWDTITAAKGPNGKGCRACRNSLRLCHIFIVDCFHGSRNRDFMLRNCPRTCGMCANVKGNRSQLLKR